MPLYEYKCRSCGRIESTIVHRGDVLRDCDHCVGGRFTRLFSIAVQRPMHEHFNPTVGQVVSSNRQFDDLLKQKSDEATERTGIEHRFVRHDPGDAKAIGVTDAGLDHSNKVRRAQGLPELPKPV
jgi:putative FmdB family regulatory protein